MSKRFVNAPELVVPDLMQGLSLDSSRVTLLDPSTGHNVAIRSSLASKTQSRRVSVLSGGGSGHEPMAAGYVGEGMLAGAVAGGVFASPSVPAITAMLNAVAAHSTGILVVVMNYQGDRLNFGMAVKDLRERFPECPVEMMLVADDVALPDAREKRGIAGTIFVLKVAGAAADQGRPLEEVAAIARNAADSIATFGVALEPCTLPGHVFDAERLGADEIELGMGIHGEPGAEKKALSSMNQSQLTNDLVADVCNRLDKALGCKTELAANCVSLAMMVNNLGAVSQAEMLIVCRAMADFLFTANAAVVNGRKYKVQMYNGSFMTSLQMTGMSVSCFMLPSDDGLMERYLHASTECTAWNQGFQLRPSSERPVLAGSHTSASATARGSASHSRLSTRTEDYILEITGALLGHCEELGTLDSRTGDGDLGDTVRRGCQQIRADLECGYYNSAAGNPSLLFKLIAASVGSMGGSSGVLTSIFLHAAAESFQQKSGQTSAGTEQSWRAAFVEGTTAVMEQGGAVVGDRTLVDALKPAADVLAVREKSVTDAAHAAHVGCESTKSMTSAKFGRSAVVRADKLLNQPDPGARAICIILEAIVSATVKG